MKKLTPIAVLLIIFVAAGARAATGGGFYDSLLARGIENLKAGNAEAAARELRIAAFGFLDQPENFETAHIYLTLAAAKLQHEAEARQSALRVLSTERAAHRYAALALSDAVRAEFETVAAKLLTSEQMKLLRGSAAAEPSVVEAPGITTDAPAPAPAARPAAEVAPATRKITAEEVPARLAEADSALAKNDLVSSRRLYGEVLEAETLDHAVAMRVGEGLYRSRDFKGAVRAFARAGAPQSGEEHFHYYRAVAFYETGDYVNAERELKVALPHIEVTPDVARYRERIEAAAVTR